jgi:hypothetical protein
LEFTIMKRTRIWRDQFQGHRVYSATAGSNVGHSWLVADTSAAGTPTYAPAADGRGLKVDHESTSEVQNLCLYFGDILPWDIDDLIAVRFKLAMNQAAVNAATTFVFGLGSARNATPDSVAANAWFRIQGSVSTTLVVAETDDGTNDNDDIATGKTLINADKNFEINFACGKRDVRFFIDGQPVARATTFDMSNFGSLLQPIFQLQKTAAVSVDGFVLREIEVEYREAA